MPSVPDNAYGDPEGFNVNFVQHPSELGSDYQGHDSAHLNIETSHQLVSKKIPPNRKFENEVKISACWENECGGQTFSNFSNLLRHQREQHGESLKVPCPVCGAKFTRTTARNTHLKNVCSEVVK